MLTFSQFYVIIKLIIKSESSLSDFRYFSDFSLSDPRSHPRYFVDPDYFVDFNIAFMSITKQFNSNV